MLWLEEPEALQSQKTEPPTCPQERGEGYLYSPNKTRTHMILIGIEIGMLLAGILIPINLQRLTGCDCLVRTIWVVMLDPERWNFVVLMTPSTFYRVRWLYPPAIQRLLRRLTATLLT